MRVEQIVDEDFYRMGEGDGGMEGWMGLISQSSMKFRTSNSYPNLVS